MKDDEVKRGSYQYGMETRAIHAGARPDPVTGARNTPIYQTTSYVFDDADHAADLFKIQTFGFIYSRLSNPTVSVLEERIANLEDGRAAVCASAGHAAQFLAFFSLLEPGDEFIASRNLYGGSITQFGISFKRLGWSCNFVDPTNPENFKAPLTPKTKAIFIEVLANPGGVVVDLEAVANIANGAGIPLLVDNTLATPYLCQPVPWGADLIVHSPTKFLSGHGTSLGGAIVESGKFDWAGNAEKFPTMTEPDPAYHGLTFAETFGDFGFTMKARAVGLRDFGPCMSPANAFYTITGMETLHLRMPRHVENAQAVAEFLEGEDAAEWVNYQGLASHPDHDLAKRLIPKGPGAMLSFGLKGGRAAGRKFIEAVKLASHLANVGDAKTLVIHPASTTHQQMNAAALQAAGIAEGMIRLSGGIEDSEDIISDLKQAIRVSQKA